MRLAAALVLLLAAAPALADQGKGKGNGNAGKPDKNSATETVVEGVTAEQIEEAHKKDLAVQKKYGVKYLKYWYDVTSGRAFCLMEAPNKEAAIAVHREAHGLMADEVIEVVEGA